MNEKTVGPGLVKHLMVVLDGSPGARQAAYTAYAVAARLGAKLIGVALFTAQSRPEAEQALREFETGARAARVGMVGELFPSLADARLAFAHLSIDAIFVGRESVAGEQLQRDWLENPAAPLWVVPGARDLLRLLALYDDAPAAPQALALALELAERWQVELSLLVTTGGVLVDEILPQGSASVVPISLHRDTEAGPAALLRRIEADAIDLAVIGQPTDAARLWQICQKIPCLLVICPVLNSP